MDGQIDMESSLLSYGTKDMEGLSVSIFEQIKLPY
jgi:hypothetical protein